MVDIRKRIKEELLHRSISLPLTLSINLQESAIPHLGGEDIITFSNEEHYSEGETAQSPSSSTESSNDFPDLKSQVQPSPGTKKINDNAYTDVNREGCPSVLHDILPPSKDYTYVVENLDVQSLSTYDSPQLSTTLRINLSTKNEADKWMSEFMEHSKCTYRVTKTTKSSMKRVLAKYTMHCQHYRKVLSQRQMQSHLQASTQTPKKPLTAGMRNKKTGCPSRLTLTILIPTKKQTRLAESNPYLVSHKAVLKLEHCHNHPVHSAHSLSFRPISDATKQQLFSLFAKGHSAASARHAHETELMLQTAEDGREVQKAIADRAINPTASDYSRLYDKWRIEEMGAENGPNMFSQLEAEIAKYNASNSDKEGRASLQRYQCPKDDMETSDCDTNGVTPPPRKKMKLTKKNRKNSFQPMILAICTPLMARANANIQQAGEMIFCDATSSLDRYNTSVFIFSTSTPTSGIPLGVVIASDEQQSTIEQGISMLVDVLPETAFFSKGAKLGPSIIMTDDSSAERSAIQKAWPNAVLLLCNFHFLQSKWTWLHDGKNNIKQHDRVVLIQKVKDLVYAETEQELGKAYQQVLKSNEVKRYPHFSEYMQTMWPRRKEWALCYRKRMLIRGNHTNNYDEAGMRILKELVFSRIKAYNVIQMFHFITETMERYYQSKLLSVAHSRVDRFISLRYQGLHARAYNKEHIQQLTKSQFSVPSRTEKNVTYDVDMQIGICTCPQGQDGSPCSHQAAVIIHFGCQSVNCIPTLDPTGKRILAHIAYGEDAIQDLSFYATLGQSATGDKEKLEPDLRAIMESNHLPQHDQLQLDPVTITEDSDPQIFSQKDSQEDVCKEIDAIADDIKQRITSDKQFLLSVAKFTKTYHALSKKSSNAHLMSAFYKFGWCFGGTATSKQGGILRRGRRIPIQAKSAGRRRKTVNRGKAAVTAGRPPSASQVKLSSQEKYFLPVRQRNTSTKKPHSLTKSISKGQQNAGRW